MTTKRAARNRWLLWLVLAPAMIGGWIWYETSVFLMPENETIHCALTDRLLMADSNAETSVAELPNVFVDGKMIDIGKRANDRLLTYCGGLAVGEGRCLVLLDQSEYSHFEGYCHRIHHEPSDRWRITLHGSGIEHTGVKRIGMSFIAFLIFGAVSIVVWGVSRLRNA